MATGRKGCFVVLLTREFALRSSDLGLIWLRHARARMGHQVVAFPTVRYILRGGRNRSVAVNSLSLIEIWETCTLLLKHPPTSRARTPLAHRRGNEGGYSNRHCPRECGRAAALRGSKLAKWQMSKRQSLNQPKSHRSAKWGGHRLLTKSSRSEPVTDRSLFL